MKKLLIVGFLFLTACGQSTINTIGNGYGLVKITYKLNATGLDNKIIPSNIGGTIYDVNTKIAEALDGAWDIRTTNDDQAKSIAQKAVKDVEILLNKLNTLGVK